MRTIDPRPEAGNERDSLVTACNAAGPPLGLDAPAAKHGFPIIG